MDDPDFNAMSVADLEKFIQDNGRKVDAIRAQNLRAHGVLLAKNDELASNARANRSADFPLSQGVGN